MTLEPRRVRGAGRLRGEIRLPSDKSIAHRALLFDAMAVGSADVTLRRPGADVLSTVQVLRDLGAVAATERMGESVTVTLRGPGTADAARLTGGGGERLDCGNSGTTMRLLCGALAGRSVGPAAELFGDASLSSRPMERVADPLRAMGADLVTTAGHAPIRVRGRRPLRSMHHELRVASAQVVGAISLAALAADGTTTIDTPAETRDHTERLLAWLGADVRREGKRTTIKGPTSMGARPLTVPGDLSSAAAWLVAGTLHPDAELLLADVSLNPTRTVIVDVLREMGADIDIVPHGDPMNGTSPEPSGDLIVRSAPRLRPISLEGGRVAALIDELPLLAVVMDAADGVSELRDAGELRVKESDRISRVVRHLLAMGVDAEELADGWRITGSRRTRPLPVEVETGGDHRIGIAFAVAALAGVCGEALIDDPACIDVSYPGFWDDLEAVSDTTMAGASR